MKQNHLPTCPLLKIQYLITLMICLNNAQCNCVLQEITWQIANNIDLEAAKTVSLMKRSPFLEMNCLVAGEPSAEALESMGMPADLIGMIASSPEDQVRVIKTHLPFEFLPQNLLDVAKGTTRIFHEYNTCKTFLNHCHFSSHICCSQSHGCLHLLFPPHAAHQLCILHGLQL